MNIDKELEDINNICEELESLTNLNETLERLMFKMSNKLSLEDQDKVRSLSEQARGNNVNPNELMQRCSDMFDDKINKK